MIYPDEHYHGADTHAQRVVMIRAQRTQAYDPECHLTRGYEQAALLIELQRVVSHELGMHCPLSGLAALAEATGEESKRMLASYLHIAPRQLTSAHLTRLRTTIIPGLQNVHRQFCAREAPQEHPRCD